MSERPDGFGPWNLTASAFLLALGAEYLKAALYAAAVVGAAVLLGSVDPGIDVAWDDLLRRPAVLALAGTVLLVWLPAKVTLKGSSRIVAPGRWRLLSPILTAGLLLVVAVLVVAGALVSDPVAAVRAVIGGGA